MNSSLESVGPKFTRESLNNAQAKTRKIVSEIATEVRARLKSARSFHEGDARKLALEIFSSHGVRKHWHQPWIRLGQGTTRTFSQPLVLSPIKNCEHFFVDVGPVFQEAPADVAIEADYGDTFVVDDTRKGSAFFRNLANLSRDLFHRANQFYGSNPSTGEELYRFLEAECEKEKVLLVKEAGGHRISDFPHQRFSKEPMAEISIVPTEALWILEVQIQSLDQKWGAFYEDVLGC